MNIDDENIKYRKMLLNKNKDKTINEVPNPTKESIRENDIDNILENETKKNKEEPWNRLDKTLKIEKLDKFVSQYAIQNKLKKADIDQLKYFLRDSLDKKWLSKQRDVVYDKQTGIVSEICNLVFNKVSRKFTLKRCEKRISSLKSLAPKKTKKKSIKVDASTNDVHKTNKTRSVKKIDSDINK